MEGKDACQAKVMDPLLKMINLHILNSHLSLGSQGGAKSSNKP